MTVAIYEPRIQPYDPPPFPSGELTVNVESQVQERVNPGLGMTVEPTGRVRIVIEGERERVAPYLEAITRVVRGETS